MRDLVIGDIVERIGRPTVVRQVSTGEILQGTPTRARHVTDCVGQHHFARGCGSVLLMGEDLCDG